MEYIYYTKFNKIINLKNTHFLRYMKMEASDNIVLSLVCSLPHSLSQLQCFEYNNRSIHSF